MRMRHRCGGIGVGGVALVLASPVGTAAQEERVVGLPCEGCEAVFVGMPETVASTSRIAPPGEPGEPMRIEGTVVDRSGTPVDGVIVYAYHTDARGIYPRTDGLRGTPAYRHGRLRGWARSDENGRYAFETIRPASYPDAETPAHVHMHVIEPDRCTYYLDSIRFTDDPRLDPRDADAADQPRGGSGLVEPGRDSTGRWTIERDIILGHGVPDYERCRGLGSGEGTAIAP
jgi:hypothetical protein